MSDGSFAQTSVSVQTARTHWRRVRTTQHSPQTHLSIAHQSDLLVSTDQGRLFLLHLPLRNDRLLTGQGNCQFLLGAPRPRAVVHSGSAPNGLPRVGTGSEWALLESPLLLHLLLKVDSEKSHCSPMAEDRDIRGKSRKRPKSSLSLAPTNAFEYKKRKPSQSTGSAI